MRDWVKPSFWIKPFFSFVTGPGKYIEPVHVQFFEEVRNAGYFLPLEFSKDEWLNRLEEIVEAGRWHIPELDVDVPIYPTKGRPAPDNATGLVLDCLLPHRHPPSVGLLNDLHDRYKPKTENIFLALLVLYADEIDDSNGVKQAYDALLTPTSPAHDRIREALSQLARQSGGEASKKAPGIWQYVIEQLTKHPCMTAKEIWRSIPETPPDEAEEKGIEVRVQRTVRGHKEKEELYWLYRDVNEDANIDKLVQRRDADGTEQAIGFKAFAKYFTKARKNLSQDAQ
jgi:hypothetical protein